MHSVDDLVFTIVVRRPTTRQHLCADRAYDYDDVHRLLAATGYLAHISPRRRRGEPPPM